MSEKTYVFGPFVYDIRRRLLFRQGSPVALGQRGKALLEALLGAEGRAVSKEELMESAWPAEHVEDNNLAIQIAGLRKCLGRSPAGHEWIATIQRVGYQFVEARAEREHLDRESPEKKLPAGKLKIGVCPFANLNDDSAHDHLPAGLTEDIITELSRFRNLMVARRVAPAFGNADTDAHAGTESGLQYSVHGSVRQFGNRMRIAVQLVEEKSGLHIWAERFDCDRDGFFDVHDQVIRRIVGTLAGQVQVFATEQTKLKPPASLTAYEYLLRGNALPFDNTESAREARRLLNKAIELDPNYARAYAVLADLTCVDWWNDMGPSDAALDQALELARTAARLDENDYTAHGALGWALMLGDADDLAEQHFLKALELNENRASVMASLGALCAYRGRATDGLKYIGNARVLDPFYRPLWFSRITGAAYFAAGRFDDTIATLAQLPDLPFWGQAYLACCHALLSRPQDARLYAARTLDLKPEFTCRRFAAKEHYRKPIDRKHLLRGLRDAGLPD
jgi:TolB-like protein